MLYSFIDINTLLRELDEEYNDRTSRTEILDYEFSFFDGLKFSSIWWIEEFSYF